MVVFAISESLKIDLEERIHRILIGGNGEGPYSRWNEKKTKQNRI